jgi:hypothetical protein
VLVIEVAQVGAVFMLGSKLGWSSYGVQVWVFSRGV